MGNDLLRAKYNLLDNYCKRLAGLSDNESGIFLLEDILDHERASTLKTIRKFKNDFISHPATVTTPNAPYEYVKFIKSLITYIHENEDYVKKQLRAKKRGEYVKKDASSNVKNYHKEEKISLKQVDRFKNYPNPRPGYRKEKFTFSKELWAEHNFMSSGDYKNAERICDAILKYFDIENDFRNDYDFKITSFGKEDLDLNWRHGHLPLPLGTKFLSVSKLVGHDGALFLFNTCDITYGSLIFCLGVSDMCGGWDEVLTYGMFYFYCDGKISVERVLSSSEVDFNTDDLR